MAVLLVYTTVLVNGRLWLVLFIYATILVNGNHAMLSVC